MEDAPEASLPRLARQAGISMTLRGVSLRMLLSLQLLPLHLCRPSATLAILCCQLSLVRGCPFPSPLGVAQGPPARRRCGEKPPLLELELRCCSTVASLCCFPQVSTSFQDKRERRAMPEPQDPQVSDWSPQAEASKGWLVPILAFLSHPFSLHRPLLL